MAQNWNKPKTEVFSPKPSHNPSESSNDINVIWETRYQVYNGRHVVLDANPVIPDGWKTKSK